MAQFELDRPISDVVPHIFKRPILTVDQKDSLLQAGTFLALGPQIYVDGLVVLDGRKIAGTMGGQHMLRHILQNPRNWSAAEASEIMNRSPCTVDAGDALSKALDIFSRTRFAFVPVLIDSEVVTSICVRDVLRLVANVVGEARASSVASKLVSVKGDMSIGSALEIMIERGIRNLAVKDGQGEKVGRVRILNDRKILEFLLSHEGRRLAGPDGSKDLFDVGVGSVDTSEAKLAESDLSVNAAASMLLDVSTPCVLLAGELIVSPWDVVMKSVYGA